MRTVRPRTAALAVLAIVLATLFSLAGPASATAPTVGVPTGTSLTTINGDYTVTTNNSTVDAKNILGKLIINATNVQVTRTRVSTTAHTGTGIEVLSGKSATIIDSTVIGFSNSVVGANYHAVRLDVSGMADDGFKIGSNVNLIGNYCHGVYVTEGSHADCAQVEGGVTNVTITGNYLDATNGNAALFIAPDLGPSAYGPIAVFGNYFNGGNYSVQAVDGASGTYHNYRTTFGNNRWGNTHTYGYENVAETSYYDYATNVRDDTGAGV
jgi:hypothetical protein